MVLHLFAMFLCQKFGVYKLVMLVRRYQLRAADACCTFPVLKVTDPSLLSVTATSSFRTDLQRSQEDRGNKKNAEDWTEVFWRRFDDTFLEGLRFFLDLILLEWYDSPKWNLVSDGVGVFRWWVLQLLEASGGAGAPAPTSLAGLVGWVFWRDFQIHKKSNIGKKKPSFPYIPYPWFNI